MKNRALDPDTVWSGHVDAVFARMHDFVAGEEKEVAAVANEDPVFRCEVAVEDEPVHDEIRVRHVQQVVV